MKTLYLDLLSGISGDMFLGALLDLGVDFGALERGLSGLGVTGYHLHLTRGQKCGITGVKFDVHLETESHHHSNPRHTHGDHHGVSPAPAAASHHHHDHDHGQHRHDHSHAEGHASPDSGGRDFTTIQGLIGASPLSDWVKARATAVFRRLAEAEGKVHGKPAEAVHFHEVGAVDSIVDIVGACLALDLLGRPRVLASSVVEGTGWVDCAHGRFPVPTPAMLELLAARGISVSQCEEPHELVTPTGAALLAELAEDFGRLSGFAVERVGYGLGTRDNRTRPNVLRVLLGETSPGSVLAETHDWESDTVAVLETSLDDLSPEILGHFAQRVLTAGALDVFQTPIQMKKGRPGTLLTVLCAVAEVERFTELILTETSAFGVRRTLAERRKLRREFRQVATRFGPVQVKIGSLDGRVVQAAPEFESCRRLAEAARVPLKAVYEAAARALAG